VMNNTFWIGVWPGLTSQQLEHMIATIKEFVHERHA
jgi:dTDP-4-amino-4,6-dideoxygalactose transaminase